MSTTPQRAADEEAARQIVQRLWNFCNLLRDDGVSYGDYLEQLTYLLFLKMAHEATLPPRRRPSPLPPDLDWPSLLTRKGEALETHYVKVLTTPPFGRKSTMKLSSTPAEGDDDEGDDLTVQREDFWVSTRNKQLAFVQHVKTMLKVSGRAAMVLPDNVLFEAGAGEKIRRRLLAECDVHTLLRLPTGIFYAQGVKANVVFFDRKPGAATPWTKRLWVYDLRTNKDFTLRTRPLRREDLDEFVRCFNPANRHDRAATWSESTPEGRWRAFGYDELAARDKCNLDMTWIPDADLSPTEAVPDPDTLLDHMTEDLRAALEQLEAIQADLARRRATAPT